MKYCPRSLFLLTFLIVFLKPTKLISQDTAASSAVTYSGFFDAYFVKNIASPLAGVNKVRVFEPTDNEFNLALGEIDFVKKAEPVGFRLDIGAGRVAGLAMTGLIQQAYVSVVVPVGSGITVDVGQFVTHMGYEVIESKDNWNYSRSILFGWAIPFYHTGARFSYPVLTNLSATLHVLNGWNQVSDNNTYKTLGLTLNYAMFPTTAIIVNAISGVEASAPIYGKRSVFDLIVTQQLTDAFSVAINADYGEERLGAGLATWKGGAGYAKYTFNAVSSAAVRYELYNDGGNFSPLSTGASKLSEITATYEYKPYDNLIVRSEVRNDMSDTPFFDGKKAPATEKSQVTLLVGAIITF